MRRYLTIGIKSDGSAEILRQSTEERHVHTRALSDLDASDAKGYDEISVVEVGGRSVVRSRNFTEVSGSKPIVATGKGGPMQETKVGRVILRSMTAPTVGEPYANSGDTYVAPQNDDEFDGMTIADLDEFDSNIDLSGSKNKQERIDRIRAYRALNENNVGALKGIATSEGVEVTGEMKKADLINAIAAKRRSASAEFAK